MRLEISKYNPIIDPNELFLSCGIPKQFGFKTTPIEMIQNCTTMYKPKDNYLFILKR